jgi:hypothetical protein
MAASISRLFANSHARRLKLSWIVIFPEVTGWAANMWLASRLVAMQTPVRINRYSRGSSPGKLVTPILSPLAQSHFHTKAQPLDSLRGVNGRAGQERSSMHTPSISDPNFQSVLQSDIVASGTPKSQKQIQNSTEDTESALALRAARLQRLLRFCHLIACTIATLAYAVAR